MASKIKADQFETLDGSGNITLNNSVTMASGKTLPAASLTGALPAISGANLTGVTSVGGATLTGMLGTSAWYAPGAAVSSLVQAIACDQQKMFPCSVLLGGEFGLNDLCIGVPVILGKNGIEKIVEIQLDDEELSQLQASAKGVKATNTLLEDLNL